jgi:hypothetical protein
VTQVYSFTDENGVTRLFAEIVPDPAFNGGTITAATTIHTSGAADEPLTLIPGAAAAAAFTLVLDAQDGQGNTVLGADAGGEVFVNTGADGLFTVTVPMNAVVVGLGPTGATMSAPPGNALALNDEHGNALLSISGSSHLGLYGHAAAAQPSLTSGTATPEQIALALQSYGAAGGT